MNTLGISQLRVALLVLIVIFTPSHRLEAQGSYRSDRRVFDAAWYLNHYPDLHAAFGNNLGAATAHWLAAGIHECRQGALEFSSIEYLALYYDLRLAYGSRGCATAVDHFLRYGSSEGRIGRYVLDSRAFNPAWYLSHYPDLKAAFGDNLDAAKSHWLNSGMYECRQGNPFFSPFDYLGKYSDLARFFGRRGCANAAQHYIQYGYKEGRFINSVPVYAGGVAGILSLSDPANSDVFRAYGGGLYIHSYAWGSILDEERRKIISAFAGSPIAVELGFGAGPGWGIIFQQHYQNYGIQPRYITVNAFADKTTPTVSSWQEYMDMLRSHGVANSTKIYPTFEYQNYKVGSELIPLSMNPQLQELISVSGGVVFDTPPRYAFDREQNYRDWIVDAIHWTRSRGYNSIIIISPHNSGTNWESDTHEYINFLARFDALPAEFVSENYTSTEDPSYPNVVGNEDTQFNTLGMGLRLRLGVL